MRPLWELEHSLNLCLFAAGRLIIICHVLIGSIGLVISSGSNLPVNCLALRLRDLVITPPCFVIHRVLRGALAVNIGLLSKQIADGYLPLLIFALVN